MTTPPPAGWSEPGPPPPQPPAGAGPPSRPGGPTTRFRLAGILLAVAGAALLVIIFALPWESTPSGRTATLADLRQRLAGGPSRWESLSYQLPFYTALAAAALALLVGVPAAAAGTRVTNILAAVAGLLAALVTLFTPGYYFFRHPVRTRDLDFFLQDLVGVGYYLAFPAAALLLAAAVLGLLGAFRAGRPLPRP